MAYYNLIVTFNISLWLGFDNLGHVNLISCFMAQPAHLFEKFKFLPVAKIPLETLKKAQLALLQYIYNYQKTQLRNTLWLLANCCFIKTIFLYLHFVILHSFCLFICWPTDPILSRFSPVKKLFKLKWLFKKAKKMSCF